MLSLPSGISMITPDFYPDLGMKKAPRINEGPLQEVVQSSSTTPMATVALSATSQP